jgi:Tfp pilus assembly protein PilO
MKKIINKIIASIHWLGIFMIAVNLWNLYEEHSIQLNELISVKRKLENDIINRKKELEEIKAYQKYEDEYKLRIEVVAKDIEKIQRQLPQETNDEKIISFLRSEMTLLNIKNGTVAPGQEHINPYSISKDYILKAEGTFLQFLVFFERLRDNERIYNIKDLKITNSNDTQKGRYRMLTFSGVIQAFRYKPDSKVERGF